MYPANFQIHAESVRTGNIADPAGTEREIVPVFQDQPDYLPETQGNDGQIVASQTEDRKAQHDPEKHSQGRRDRQSRPEAEPEMIIQKGV